MPHLVGELSWIHIIIITIIQKWVAVKIVGYDIKVKKSDGTL